MKLRAESQFWVRYSRARHYGSLPNQRGSLRRNQGRLQDGRRIGQYGFSTNVPRPEISTAAYERAFAWPISGAGGLVAQTGLVIVPKGYVNWNRGVDSCNFTGRSVFTKNISMQVTYQFPKTSQNFEPIRFRFVTGFIKMGMQWPVAPTLGSGHASNGFCDGMVLNYKATDALNQDADPLEIHSANVVNENIGQSHGSINACGNINRTAIVVTSDQTRSIKADTLIDYDEDEEESKTFGNRNDLIMNYNWQMNKRMQLTPVTRQTTVAAGSVAGAHHFAPVNDPRNMIPFYAVFLENAGEFTSAADLPSIKVCETTYFVDT